MDLREARYYMEHRMRPHLFFTGPSRLVSVLAVGKGEFLFNIMNDICENNQVKNVYAPKDFEVSIGKAEEGLGIIKLRMPEPLWEPLCYRIYLIFDEPYKKLGYFTVERGAAAGEVFLCCWNTESSHMSFGTEELSEEEEAEKCVRLYKDPMG